MAKKGATNHARSIYQSNKNSKQIMWIGVFILSSIILVLWGWAFIARISTFKLDTIPETQLLAKTKKNWDAVFEQTKAEEDRKQNLVKLKNMLKELQANYTSSTQDSATSSPITSTATTTISTTTKTQ